MTAQDIPQVGLFGSMKGDWREKHIIPVLKTLGVTYFHPGAEGGAWTEEMGRREAEVLASCETIVMVINDTTPAFGGLAEAGWSALGAARRGQMFILCVELEYTWKLPRWMRLIPGLEPMRREAEGYAVRTRSLVVKHAKEFENEIAELIVAENMEQVIAALKEKYAPTTGA